MPSVIQKLVKSEAVAQKTQAQPIRPPKSVAPKMRTKPIAPRAPKKKKKGSIAVPIAATAGGLAGVASLPNVEKRMGKKISKAKLRQKIQPGDIVLTGRRTTYAHIPADMRKKWWEKIFWRGLKPASGAYTPHGMLALGTGKAKGKGTAGYKRGVKNVIHQGEEVFTQKLHESLKETDRFVVMRPKEKPSAKTLGKVFAYAKGKKGSQYGELASAVQGAGAIVVPKKIRDLCTPKKGKMFCTSFPTRAYEEAGAKIVPGKARTALAKDVLTSGKLKTIGWAGAPISKLERFQVKTLPRVVRGAAWAGAAGAAAYGAKKIIDKYRKAGKKTRTK